MIAQSTPPQINISKIHSDGSIAGAIFAIATVFIFFVGIPTVRYFFPAAIALGCVFALLIYVVRRFARHHHGTGAPWILTDLIGKK
jgi:hypothetical protein